MKIHGLKDKREKSTVQVNSPEGDCEFSISKHTVKDQTKYSWATIHIHSEMYSIMVHYMNMTQYHTANFL